jgi:HNH endonuclease
VNQEMAFAEEPVEHGCTSTIRVVQRPFRDAAFTRVIQRAYSKTCAMTGLKLVNGGGRCDIEAAHILPVERQGPDSPRNGIALSRTVHWLFDRGILSISDKGKILIARGLLPDPIRRMLNPDGLILPPLGRGPAAPPSFSPVSSRKYLQRQLGRDQLIAGGDCLQSRSMQSATRLVEGSHLPGPFGDSFRS